MDSAFARHRDHFHQLDARAPVRDAHGRSVRGAAVTEVVMSAAEPHDRPQAVPTEELRAEIQRRLDADAIEHESRTARTGNAPYPLCGFLDVAVVDDVVRAQRSRVLELAVIDIGGDDVHRSERPKKLNGHVTEAAH